VRQFFFTFFMNFLFFTAEFSHIFTINIVLLGVQQCFIYLHTLRKKKTIYLTFRNISPPGKIKNIFYKKIVFFLETYKLYISTVHVYTLVLIVHVFLNILDHKTTLTLKNQIMLQKCTKCGSSSLAATVV
jgi:Tfp pilus assembly protein PilZ